MNYVELWTAQIIALANQEMWYNVRCRQLSNLDSLANRYIAHKARRLFK